MDYAAPDRAAANNDDPFIYHFWCPLYNGEMEDSAIVEFHTININNSLASGNNGGNLNKVKDVAVLPWVYWRASFNKYRCVTTTVLVIRTQCRIILL